MLRHTHPDDLAAIRSQCRPPAKVVMIYGMKILPASFVIQDHCQQYTYIFLSLKLQWSRRLFFRKSYPIIFIHPFRIIEIIDHGIGYPAIIG